MMTRTRLGREVPLIDVPGIPHGRSRRRGRACTLPPRTMLAFVTVGSTKFDALVQAVCTDAVLDALHAKGYNHLVVQAGNSMFEHSSRLHAAGISVRTRSHGIEQEYYKFKPSLREDYERADLVISHAGSGTILDVLRIPKPLIIVPNPTLLDNHQQELADVLEQQGHLVASTPQCVRHRLLRRCITCTLPTLRWLSLRPHPRRRDGVLMSIPQDTQHADIFTQSYLYHHLVRLCEDYDKDVPS
ncbi:glycosyltransferase family 28 C-terminal domain-containing protein [Schizophyllum commune]